METEHTVTNDDLPKTVEEMDNFVRAMFEKRKVIEAKSDELKTLNKEMAQIEAQAVAALKQLDRDKYQSEHGTIFIVEKWRVNVPSTNEEKEAFFTFLRERGKEVLYKYATVNSNSLNSFFNEEWEVAKQEGRGMEYSMPGVQPPKLHESLSMRKK